MLALHCWWWWCCIWWWGGLHLDLSPRRDSFGHLKLREQCWNNCLLQFCWLHQSNMQLQSVTEWMNDWQLMDIALAEVPCIADLICIDLWTESGGLSDWRSPNKIDTARDTTETVNIGTGGTWSECCMRIVNLHRPEPLSSSSSSSSFD